MTSRLPIFGIGTVVIDHVVTLPGFPTADTKCEIETSWRQIGGPIPVALSVAAHYGANTSFCGRWGNDPIGQEIRDGLTSGGIDLATSQSRDEWASGFAQVWIDGQTGQRTVAYSRGEFPAPTANDLQNSHALRDAHILHLDGTAPAAAIFSAESTKARGGRVILDAGSKKPGMENLLPLVDVMIASDQFCQHWFGTTDVSLQQLRDLGPATAIHTLGDRGAVFDEGDGEVFVPAKKINPVDTNGAGDIFCGALVYGLSCEWDLHQAVTFANAAAGYACGHQGNSTWMPL